MGRDHERKDHVVKIDVGCGRGCREGFVGVDRLKLPGVKIIHDLDLHPYPFADNMVDEVWMDNVLEHLANPLGAMEEIHRITRSGAIIHIAVPYFRSFYATIDPTHRNFFGVHWFNYFDPRHVFFKKYHYSEATFHVEHLEFDREFAQVSKRKFLYWLMRWIAKKKPAGYEARLSHLYPLNSLTFHLKTVKDGERPMTIMFASLEKGPLENDKPLPDPPPPDGGARAAGAGISWGAGG